MRKEVSLRISVALEIYTGVAIILTPIHTALEFDVREIF